jgi:integrase
MPLKLTRRHSSPNWYIRGTVRGVNVDESTGFSDRKAAQDILTKRAAEITLRAIHGDAAVVTFPQAALSFMEAGGERTHLATLIRHFQRAKLATIGQAEIDEAAAKLKPGAAPATINRQIIAPISAVLHHAARKKWCAKPVIARRREPKGRVRWITHGEAERLIENAGHLRPLVIFLLSTGARLSEALYIEWKQIDLSACQATFLDTKNGETRSVPLHPKSVAALANLPHRKGMVFRRHYGFTNWKGEVRALGDSYANRHGTGGGQVKTAWATMLKKAEISDFTPHDCRHTWASWHYAANRDIRSLMELGGWKTLSMVERYTHINVSHLASGQAKIWGNGGDVAEMKVATTNPVKA